jgi:hypothetical protein
MASSSRQGPRGGGGGIGVPQDSESRLHTIVEVLQTKYEENLHVISAIYNEKKDMELKIRALEARLRSSGVDNLGLDTDYYPEQNSGSQSGRSRGPPQDWDSSMRPSSASRSKGPGHRYDKTRNADVMTISHGDEDMPPEESTWQSRRPASTSNNNSNSRMSAAEVAASFDKENYSYTGNNHVRYDSRSVGPDRPRSASSNHNRSSTSSLGDYYGNGNRRARSAGQYTYGRGISAELRASQNKYVQTVAMSRLAEDAKRQKQVEYEKYLKDRLSKAGHKKPFRNLEENVAAFKKKMEEKLNAKRAEIEGAKKAEIQQRRDQIREHIHKPRDGLFSGLGWERLNEKMRNEREERRRKYKEELQTGVKPFDLHASIRTAKLQEQEEKLKAGMVTRVVVASKANEERAHRDQECEKRRIDRMIRQQAKEREELDQKLEAERRNREKLLNTKLPESSRRLTKAAEERARTVREQIEKERQDEKDRQKALEEKQKREREHAAVIKQSIKLVGKIYLWLPGI